MGLFNYQSEEAEELHAELISSTDGTEPCYDPHLLESDRIYESHTDFWVENFSNRGISPEQAEQMCAGCHVLELCREYAIKNNEPYYVWGGTTPQQRGFYRGRKRNERRTD